MSRRDQIRMSPEEVRAFLDASRTIVVNSIGPDGVPHPMPMWYGVEDDGSIVMTTFRKSQKVRNLERDPRVSLLVEDGASYAELRGVVVYGEVEILPGTEDVLGILRSVTARTQGRVDESSEAVREGLRRTATKRVGLRVRPEKIVSWDHRKLAGVY